MSGLAGRVHGHHGRVTVHGRPSAILISPEDLEALEIMRNAAAMIGEPADGPYELRTTSTTRRGTYRPAAGRAVT